MMRPALAGRILLLIKILRKAYISSYFFASLIVIVSVAILSSYFLTSFIARGAVSSYHIARASTFLFSTILCCTFARESDGGGPEDHKEISQSADWVEYSGGNGPRVAAYLRVSTSRQAKEGFSLEAQREQLNKLKNECKPFRIYWFRDAGKSGVDFDKRKINAILELKEKGKITELWATNIDRIGRECRKLLYFFLEFCDDGAIIRTPEREYILKDLSSFLIYVIEAHTSEQANRRRTEAAIAGKAQSFKQKRWNKATPPGYRKEIWLEKIPEWEPLIEEAYSLFLRKKNMEFVRRLVNKKYKHLLSEPLTRARIKRILSDPVYIGKPEHLGQVVLDASLAYVDEETFFESLETLESIRKRYKPDRVGPMEELAVTQPISVLEFLNQFDRHHRGCGGLVTKNGTKKDARVPQQILICNECGKQWKYPTLAQLKKIQEQFSRKNSIGPLVFENDSLSESFKETKKLRKKLKKKNDTRRSYKQNLGEFLN